MAPRKPGNINPEGSGKGSMPALGRSSQNTAAANRRAGAGAAAKAAQAKGIKETINVEAMKKYFAARGYTSSQIKTIFSGKTVKRGR